MLREAINIKIKELGIRRSKIADDLIIARSELSNYLNGRRGLAVKKIELVLRYLGMSVI